MVKMQKATSKVKCYECLAGTVSGAITISFPPTVPVRPVTPNVNLGIAELNSSEVASRAGQDRPSALTMVTSTLVERTLKVLLVGSMGPKRGMDLEARLEPVR